MTTPNSNISYQPIYTPDELEGILGDKTTTLIAVLSQEDYDEGHIPSSYHVLPTQLTLNEKPAPGLLPDTESLIALIHSLGITDQTHVIAYDNSGGSVAGRFIWTLALFGLENTSMLNGGLKAWKNAGKAVSQTPAKAESPSSQALGLNFHFLADKQEVIDSLSNDSVIIWDARGEDEYSGEKVLAERGGHIPNAISHNWIHLHDENTAIKDLADIKSELDAKGITEDKLSSRIAKHTDALA